MTYQPSTRAKVITRRTYNRPLNDEATEFESWDETVGRVTTHQRWLWERASGEHLNMFERDELIELAGLLKDRKVSVAGRTLWLGGTDKARKREASQFNCSFKRVETVHDAVDLFWLLLQGCGTGFMPVTGHLNGFAKPMNIHQNYSERDADYKGNPNNIESYNPKTKIWSIKVGDSAEAWAKTVGKIIAHPYPQAETIIIDTTDIRGAGKRVDGYGWICTGDKPFQKAMFDICMLFNKRVGKLLTAIDIVDLMNHLGTILSTRRSAEIALLHYGHQEWEDFSRMKKNHWEGNPQRSQSNNSIVFETKPSRKDLEKIFDIIEDSGGSEPAFINAETARKRANWFGGVNPCAEILLSGAGSFCNLVEVDLAKFNGDFQGLLRAIKLIARANYRQTCVNLDDGILSKAWNESNNFLRLCGVGLTGIVRWEYKDSQDHYKALKREAKLGAESMAKELGLPLPQAVTTVKPSGTISKIMDTTEGVHKPLGRYIFNNVNFQSDDPLVKKLEAANYRVQNNPYDNTGSIVTFPIAWDDVDFTEVDGLEVNIEPAITQLNRYKLLMDNYVDHNCSVTISYSPEEVPQMITWILDNWDTYVGVSFLYRNDPTKSAKDLGYPYLPQEVTSKSKFDEYVKQLKEFDLDDKGIMVDELEDDCEGGACPIR